MVNSSNDMVNELNNISDYVATMIASKTEELNNTVKTVDEKLEECRMMFNRVEESKVVEFPVKNISNNVMHSRKSEIEELYNEGYSAEEIARELNVGRGEIELMLGMTERYLSLAN